MVNYVDEKENEMSNEVMNKEKWVAMFREIGLDDQTMTAWHQVFETKYPDGHQSFLEWLGISGDEIKAIRVL